MQYILTKEEIDALVPKAALDELSADYAKASLLVARATRGSCIHDPDKPGKPRNYGYCDDCGMANLDKPGGPRCPFPRNFSQ